jgi:hypothetical protein
MADKRKNTRAYTRVNPDIPMHIYLPQAGRKNLNKKRIDPNPTWKPRSNVSVNSPYQLVVGRESSSLSSGSENTRLLGGLFSTPLQDESIFQEKDMSPERNASPRPDLMVDMNHRLGLKSSFEDHFNPRAIPYMETNLIDLDDPANSEVTSADPKEV